MCMLSWGRPNLNWCQTLTLKRKSEKDLPQRERKVVLEWLKTNLHLKGDVDATINYLNPRQWMLDILGLYDIEPFLTELCELTDGRYPMQGSFEKIN